MSITIKTKQGDKQYTTVAERVQMVHEAGKSLEVLESAPVQAGDGWLWRVLLRVDGLTYVGNAEVHLNSTNFAEKADPWATAETSAVGRALAWSGYAGTPDSIASADEIVRNQPQAPQSDDLAAVKAAVRDLGLVHNPQQWADWKAKVLGRDIKDAHLTPAHLLRMREEVLSHTEAA